MFRTIVIILFATILVLDFVLELVNDDMRVSELCIRGFMMCAFVMLYCR